MKKLLLLASLLLPNLAFSQSVFRVQKFCEVGGQKAVTQGLNSVTNIQRSFPRCTVTVYLTGTTTIAAVYSDNLTPPTPLANPFTANVDGSWGFYAGTGSCYDVVTSGGNPGDTFPAPFTYSNVCVGGGGGGTGVNPGTPYQVTRYDPTGVNIQDSTGSDNPTNGPTRWVQGLSVEGNAGYRFFVNSSAGTTLNLLVCRDTSVVSITQVTTCPVSSNSVFGLADNGSGVTGNVRVAMIGFHPCVFDNQTIIGDWAVPSSSTAGQCSDAGASKPTTQQVLGHVTTLNTGADTLATVDLWTGDTISGGGATVAIGPCAGTNCNAYYPTTNSIAGDVSVTDDGAGNMTMKSAGFTDSTKSGFYYQTQGAVPTPPPANSIEEYAPTSVTLPYSEVRPGASGTTGQTRVIASTGTDANGHVILNESWGSAGGVEAQANSVDNLNCVLGVCPLINLISGTNTTVTNPSGGVWRIDAAGAAAPQASNPSAPTLTPNTPGTTSYTYAVVGCEDINCVYHSAMSGTTTTATGNANLGTGSIKLTAYADSLYGYRFIRICRTASAGTPPSTGVIAAGAGKQFTDTGLVGDGTNCASVYASNTTVLDQHCLASANPAGINVMPGAPCGVDAPPTSPNALDDENTASSGAPADANNTVWTWQNQNSATATWSQGNIVLTAAARSSFNITCILQPVPTAPYTFVGAMDNTWLLAANSSNQFGGMGFFETSSNKFMVLAELATLNAVGNVVVYKANPGFSATSATGTLTTPNFLYFKLANDGTNVTFSTSPDGITYTQQFSEPKATFFTTAPSHVGFCFSPFGAMSMDIDYFRRTQ